MAIAEFFFADAVQLAQGLPTYRKALLDFAEDDAFE